MGRLLLFSPMSVRVPKESPGLREQVSRKFDGDHGRLLVNSGIVEAYLSCCGGGSKAGRVVATVWDIAATVVGVEVVVISGNCWRKLASRSSPGFCELLLEDAVSLTVHQRSYTRNSQCCKGFESRM